VITWLPKNGGLRNNVIYNLKISHKLEKQEHKNKCTVFKEKLFTILHERVFKKTLLLGEN
jgi:hypothetical protein